MFALENELKVNSSIKLGEDTYTFSNDASIAIDGLFTKVLLGELSREAYEQQIAGYVEAAENTKDKNLVLNDK